MKHKTASLILGLCLVVVASPTFARTNTGFSAFHVESPIGSDPYTCLTEDNGEVTNNCTYNVTLEFDLPIDTANTKTITVMDGFNGTDAENTFSCISYSYTGKSSVGEVGSIINFTAPGQKLSTTVLMPTGYTTIQLICGNVPPGGSVAGLSWNQ